MSRPPIFILPWVPGVPFVPTLEPWHINKCGDIYEPWPPCTDGGGVWGCCTALKVNDFLPVLEGPPPWCGGMLQIWPRAGRTPSVVWRYAADMAPCWKDPVRGVEVCCRHGTQLRVECWLLALGILASSSAMVGGSVEKKWQLNGWLVNLQV